MSGRLICGNAHGVTLTRRIPAGTEIVAGEPVARVLELTALGEAGTEAGVEIGLWEMTAGAARDVEADEVFVVLSGQGTVAFDDGSEIALGPGVVVHLREGDRTLWTVTETLRKIYLSR